MTTHDAFQEWTQTPTLDRHPLSKMFGSMTQDQFDELVDDIQDNGLDEPIKMYEDQVFDGWHRYQACLFGEVAPAFVDYNGDNPIRAALSANLHRRHLKLNPSQRAILVGRAYNWMSEVDEDGEEAFIPPLTEMAAEAEVSPRTMQRARQAEERGDGDGILHGGMRVSSVSADDDEGSMAEAPPRLSANDMLKAEVEVWMTKCAERDQKIGDLENRLGFLEDQKSPEPSVQDRRFGAMEQTLIAERAEKERYRDALQQAKVQIRLLERKLRGAQEEPTRFTDQLDPAGAIVQSVAVEAGYPYIIQAPQD